MARKKTSAEIYADRARDAKRESKHVEFKERFDPGSAGEWCELIKDFVAIGNSGGGVVVVGLRTNGSASGADIAPVLTLDGATIGDKLFKYTGEHLSGFDVTEVRRGRLRVAAVFVNEFATPVAFTQAGDYMSPTNRTKSAFARGTIYVRHGAKSEPATTNDVREMIDRKVASVRDGWMTNIRQVVSAPEGSEIAIYKRTGTGAGGEPTAIRLTTEPGVPTYGKLDPDDTHPYRQKELVQQVNSRLTDGASINRYDVDCVRRVHGVNEDASDFCHLPKFGSMQYSDAFVDWLVEQFERDPEFYSRARDRYLQMRRGD